MLRILLTTVLVLLISMSPVRAEQRGPKIRVGLVVNQFSVTLESKGKIKLDSNTGKDVTLNPGKHFLSLKQGELYADQTKIGGSVVSVLATNAKLPLMVNQKNYRGGITAVVNSNKKTLNVVNTLPVEDYLYGVIAKEVLPLWPDEAIKAQTVAARSFALYALNNHDYPNYDIRANDMGQVYGGLAAEHVNTNKLVDATCGVAVLSDGKPIQAFFHSCSGGYTESAVYVWGNPVSYLQAVVDYDQDAPNFAWDKTYTRDQLQRTLELAGYQVGVLEGIRLSPRKPAPMKPTINRGISGRVRQITFKGKKNSVTLTGDQVRNLLGLNSTLFDIVVGLQRPDYIEVPILNSYGVPIGTKKIPIKKDTRGTTYTGTVGDLHLLTDVKDEKIFFYGNGWGHGLGMSQWGARGMALGKDARGKKDYYKTILEHYYTGTTVRDVY